MADVEMVLNDEKNNFIKISNLVNIRPHTSRKLVLSKLKLEVDQQCKEEIKDYFENPTKYLEVTDQIVVGKNIAGPRYDSNGKIVSFSVVGNPKIMQNKSHTHRATVIAEDKNKKVQDKVIENLQNFELLDEAKVTNLFDLAKERITCNKKKSEMFNLSQQKEMTRKKFSQQETLLVNQERARQKSAKISQYLSKVSQKPEDELLMNRVDAFRYKKQLIDIIEKDKKIDEKYGDNCWIISLRRPKNPNKIRTAYVNVGSNLNPVWDQIHEYPSRNVELIKRPQTSCKEDLKRLYSGKHFSKTCQKLKVNLGQIDCITNLEVKGKNLFEEELRQAKRSTASKILYKEVEDQKWTQVFDEAYDERIYLKNHQFGLK